MPIVFDASSCVFMKYNVSYSAAYIMIDLVRWKLLRFLCGNNLFRYSSDRGTTRAGYTHLVTGYPVTMGILIYWLCNMETKQCCNIGKPNISSGHDFSTNNIKSITKNFKRGLGPPVTMLGPNLRVYPMMLYNWVIFLSFYWTYQTNYFHMYKLLKVEHWKDLGLLKKINPVSRH